MVPEDPADGFTNPAFSKHGHMQERTSSVIKCETWRSIDTVQLQGLFKALAHLKQMANLHLICIQVWAQAQTADEYVPSGCHTLQVAAPT